MLAAVVNQICSVMVRFFCLNKYFTVSFCGVLAAPVESSQNVNRDQSDPVKSLRHCARYFWHAYVYLLGYK